MHGKPERKGFVTEADLEVYASSAGLPASYARSFVSAVLGPGSSGGLFGTGRRRAISFPAFLAFVKTREAALMAAFNHFGELASMCKSKMFNLKY